MRVFKIETEDWEATMWVVAPDIATAVAKVKEVAPNYDIHGITDESKGQRVEVVA